MRRPLVGKESLYLHEEGRGKKQNVPIKGKKRGLNKSKESDPHKNWKRDEST